MTHGLKEDTRNTKDVEFQVLDWDYYHEDDNDDDDGDNIKKYIIRLYGMSRDQQSVFVKVKEYTPHFYVEIPKKWTKQKVMILVDTVKEEIKKYKAEYVNSLKTWELVDRHIFWEFTNYKLFTFIRLIFHSYEGFRIYANAFNRKIKNWRLDKDAKKYRVFESNIEPLLRCMHIRKLNAVGWIRIPAKKYQYFDENKKPSINDICIYTDWTNIEPIDDKNISPFRIAAFDIECESEDGSFPQPERDNDRVIQIGTTFSKYGENECYYKHIITLGSCDPIEGVVVESYNNEVAVLKAWTKLLIKMNPDVLTGYNIFGFDYKYLYDRAKKLGCSQSFSKLGRIVNEQTNFIDKELNSSALGQNFLRYYAMQGRIQIDLMKVVQRDFKLGSYKLDNVVAEFIKEIVDEVTIDEENETSTITTKNTYGLDKDRYIKIYFNDGLSDNSYKNEIKFKVLNLTKNNITISGILDGEAIELKKYKVYWCQAKDDVSANDIFRLQKGTSKDRAIVARYCINDCVLCNKLINKLHVLTNNIGMANVCHVPLSYIFLRGQGIKIFSLVSKKCREKNHLIPVIKKPPSKDDKNKNNNKDKNGKIIPPNAKKILESEKEDEDEEGYEGATVFVPTVGVHFEPISVLDYNSLYPNSQRYRNLSHECLVKNPQYDNLPGYHYENITYTNKDGSMTTCRYARSINGPCGILPEILTELLDARAQMRALAENEPDPFKQKILDSLQLAYKITANSLYGQCGAITSPIYMKDVAASTTATGREMLNAARIFTEIIFNMLVDTIKNGTYIDYEKQMKLLFNKKIDELIGKKHVKELKQIKEGEPVERYYYLRIFKENRDPIDDKKFIDKRANVNNKEEFIKWMYDKIQILLKNYDIKPSVIYGDSVTKDTPILLKYGDDIKIMKIEDIGKHWKEYNQFKSNDRTLTEKQQDDNIDLQVWTDQGWSKIKRVIRHKTPKNIFRICTYTGVVDVTEDHSLLDTDGNKLKPENCIINETRLLTAFPNIENNNYSKLTYDEAYIYGFFMGDGSCDIYNTKYGIEYQWFLCNADYNLLKTLKNKCKNIYKENEFTILDTIKSSNVYKLVLKGKIKPFSIKYRKKFYDNDGYKIIPDEIINGSTENKEAFLEGYYAANGCRKDTERIECHRFDIKGKISAMNMYFLIKSLGYNASINTRKDKMDIYRINYSKQIHRKEKCTIKKIYKLGQTNDYVYDLETDIGHFHAGIGELIVKNTDSIFIKFNIMDPETDETLKTHEALEKSIELGIICSKLLHKILPTPQNMGYEKTYQPFIILSKKRYVGLKYEFDPNKCVQNSMGIVLKRRDNAPIVKIVIGGTVRSILNDKDTQKAVAFVKKLLHDILSGKYPLDKFIITKTLKGPGLTKEEARLECKKPKENRYYADRTRIVHAVLADRMADRDHGNKPQSNDRIPYAYILVEKDVDLQGDRVEHPDYIKENDLRLDYLFYITNQIMKPAIQFLEHIIDHPEKLFNDVIMKEMNRRNGKRPLSYYFDLLEQIKQNDDAFGDLENTEEEEERYIEIDNIFSCYFEKETSVDKNDTPNNKRKKKKKKNTNINTNRGKKGKKQIKSHNSLFDKNQGGFILDS